MKTKKKKIIIITSVILACALIASIGYIVYNTVVVPSEHKEKYEQIQNDYKDGKIKFQKPSNLSVNQGDDSDMRNDSQEKNESEISSNNSSVLEPNNGNNNGGSNGGEPYTYTYEYEDRMIGWMSIPGTSVNYPVMYYEGDNSFYLTHDYTNRYDVYGSLFLDGDQQIGSQNMTIYGHNNNNTYYKSMFTEVANYQYSNFFNNHPTVYFDIGDDSTEYEVVGAIIINMNKKTYNYTRSNFGNGDDFIDFVTTLYDNCSVKKDGVTFSENDSVITLSTCTNRNNSDRVVVLCKKI